jgi:hypothetical protein
MRMALAISIFIAAMLNPVILVDTAKATFAYDHTFGSSPMIQQSIPAIGIVVANSANIVSLGIALMLE